MGGEAIHAAGEATARLAGDASTTGTASLTESRRRWAMGLALLFAAVLLSAELHARSSRQMYAPPPEFQRGPWAMVADAAAAFRVWRAAELGGRRVVILSGRWSRPQARTPPPPTRSSAAGPLEASREAPELIDVDNALYAAGQIGIARRFSVAMPQRDYDRRYAEASVQPEFAPEPDGKAFALPYHGFPRRFSVPERLDSTDEPSLVLVEPSFFRPGAESPAAVLARQGIRFDLALVALEDPAADEPQRAAALEFAERAGAYWLETEE